jgi:hypothetical protein
LQLFGHETGRYGCKFALEAAREPPGYPTVLPHGSHELRAVQQPLTTSIIASNCPQIFCVEQAGNWEPPSHLLPWDSHPLLELLQVGVVLQLHPELPHLHAELPQLLDLQPLGSAFGAQETMQQAESRSRFSNDSTAEIGRRDHPDCRARRLECGWRSERKGLRLIQWPPIKRWKNPRKNHGRIKQPETSVARQTLFGGGENTPPKLSRQPLFSIFTDFSRIR